MNRISDEMAANFKDGPVLKSSCKIEVANAVMNILNSVGEDPTRDGLRNTPDRVARMYDELLVGYTVDPVKLLNNALFDVEYDQMVVVTDIEFYSMCEHHLLPIIGRAHVAYLPDRRVVGISKLARVVEAYARRLQIQEKMTAQIANTIDEVLRPQGTAVVIEAAHQCMTTRGIHKPGVVMVTSRMLGAFRDNPSTRREFLQLIGNPTNTGGYFT